MITGDRVGVFLSKPRSNHCNHMPASSHRITFVAGFVQQLNMCHCLSALHDRENFHDHWTRCLVVTKTPLYCRMAQLKQHSNLFFQTPLMHLKLLKRGEQREELAERPRRLQGLPQQPTHHKLAVANARLNHPLYQLKTRINRHPLVLLLGTMMLNFQQFQKLVQWCQLPLIIYSQVTTFAL
ncbi:uncharacterized protein LACBIDRAFT_317844 [Laccaria bicolor S238N-H82]|uniref:Predicted protein n=1 Tax=Laccaria bicolor (strain S238N-H82 / ATCC MYA-4686) TaxID=486041 RepID=B0D5D2_LACBS|nr:uncharacterized protein LACBIDRAFT_317844 [Laccaria bicolor S238N-H82]EDR09753.1 predicted protein [Laccaria bicolor S238N-H82]|eukprot:XP_001879138.1 predicted protein [Laccaria bicolor S238N-H82]